MCWYTRWAKSRYTVYSIYYTVYLLFAHPVEDTKISAEKVSVSTDINISEIPLQFSDALFLNSYVPSEPFYLVKIK